MSKHKIHTSTPLEIIDKDKEEELNKYYYELFMKLGDDFKKVRNQLSTVLVEAENSYNFDRHHNIYKGFMKCIKSRCWEDKL